MNEQINTRAAAIRNELIDDGIYNVEHLNYLLDLQEVEDDGFESLTSKALSLLVVALSAEASA